MVDRDLVLKKLAFIETRVRELKTVARVEALETDIREERFVIHTLQLAAQAAIVSLDVVRDVVRNHLPDLPAFTTAIGGRFEGQ